MVRKILSAILAFSMTASLPVSAYAESGCLHDDAVESAVQESDGEVEEMGESEETVPEARLVLDGDTRYLVYPDNTRYTGWYTFESGKKVYCDPDNDGILVRGLQQIEGNYYLFSSKGYLKTNGIYTYNSEKYRACGCPLVGGYVVFKLD